ncbi:UbiA family prenyltransferase [Ancylobacter sp. Lp-2]|uniref:UbiA family prenyltransferase n=1 Tax=Ancylobacter sp. Lp-2 TaxID=2881339 RepID=UPI001E4B7E90|nr:UbiA family prenyltransferase [Ancylobacter sp. Lp-2]MCB4767113.1 UbiA family prenyltransferase [Ancylobacter sp. Lp-2]
MDPPLVVDLDGTLIRTDLLLESFFVLLSVSPYKALKSLVGLPGGKAALKSRLADEAVIEFDTLPFNEEVLSFIGAEREKGRKIYLASAADIRYAQALADCLGLFDGVFGSQGTVNLAGGAKARSLCDAFGEGGFDYIGDAPVDKYVWRKARNVYVADARPAHLAEIRTWAPHAEPICLRHLRLKDYLSCIRIHQWLKNTLIFVPAIAAHQFFDQFLTVLIAFVSFSLGASSVYVLNDLLDLKSDRAHSRKKDRAFASGRIPILHGVILCPVLLSCSILLSLLLPVAFLQVFVVYYAVTCAYSFHLKKKLLVDVVVLACLYGSRLWAGAVATGIVLSPWLIAFAIFIFFCLALVKRCSELIDRLGKDRKDPVGRAYRLNDLPALQFMSAASGYVSLLVLALYLNSDAVRALYTYPDRLWVICIILLFWISRILLLTQRGEMHDDPVVFAATDRTSLLSAAACSGAIAISI